MRQPNERGFVMVTAVIFSMTLLAFVGSIIGSGVSLRQQSRYQIASQGAQQAAESGVHIAVAYLGGPNRDAFLAAGETKGVIKGSGEKASQYRVLVAPAGADGLDNDQDGQVDETDEADMLEVTSRGDFDGVGRTVRVTLLARYATPSLPGATYFADPLAALDFNGNAFGITGHDVDLNGNATGVIAPGIGVNGDPTALINQITSQQADNVIGSGGTPSVVQVPPIDIQAMIEDGARAANVVLADGGNYKPDNPGDWGTIDSPAIVYGEGDIKISGGAEGAGILIVNGSLEISGAFEWKGLVVVQGQVIFKGGGGGKRLVGSLVVEDNVVQQDSGELEVSGTIDIIFSQATVAKVSQVFATYAVLNWREGPNPPEEALP